MREPSDEWCSNLLPLRRETPCRETKERQHQSQCEKNRSRVMPGPSGSPTFEKNQHGHHREHVRCHGNRQGEQGRRGTARPIAQHSSLHEHPHAGDEQRMRKHRGLRIARVHPPRRRHRQRSERDDQRSYADAERRSDRKREAQSNGAARGIRNHDRTQRSRARRELRHCLLERAPGGRQKEMLRARQSFLAHQPDLFVAIPGCRGFPTSEQKIEQENAESESNRDSIGRHEASTLYSLGLQCNSHSRKPILPNVARSSASLPMCVPIDGR
jgi:hypothetical protein